jgi:1-deoxy-D-xylulose-5-phosphate synthase
MIPVVGQPISKWLPRVKEAIQHYMQPGLIFEELGFRYFGPVDGHDVHRLISQLRDLKETSGPVFLHVITRKGAGYEHAEKDPSAYHGVSPGSRESPVLSVPDRPETPERVDCCKFFGPALTRLAREEPRVLGITAAMPSGTGLGVLRDEIPERYYDVGICEQHAVALAGGMAMGGALPVVAIYSTFLQRGYDQVMHELALQSAHVVLCMDRAGVVGGDGMTANGAFDIGYLRPLPGTTLLAPADLPELDAMLAFALGHEGVVALRWPKEGYLTSPLPGNGVAVEAGRGVVLREGTDVALLAYGAMVERSLDAAARLQEEGLSATVVNARFAKPLDEELVRQVAADHPLVATVEDHALIGGFGSAVLECLAEQGAVRSRVVRLGLPDRFIEHGDRATLLDRLGLSPARIAARIKSELARTH